MNKSIEKLRKLNALDCRLAMTPMGSQLNRMGVDPEIGKMVLYGLCFGCYRPIAIIAAALSHKSPFQKLNDVHAIRQQHRMRLQFAIDSESDFVALMRAFECWIDEGMSQRRWAEEHHLNFEAMKMIDRILRDFDMRISRTTFISPESTNWDRNARRLHLITGVLSGVLQPNLVTEKRRHVVTMAKVRISDESVCSFKNIDCNVASFYEMLKMQNNSSSNQWTAWELNPATDACLLLFAKPVKVGKNKLQWFGEGRYEMEIPIGEEHIVDQMIEIGDRMNKLIMAIFDNPKLLHLPAIMNFFDLIAEILGDRPETEMTHAGVPENYVIPDGVMKAPPGQNNGYNNQSSEYNVYNGYQNQNGIGPTKKPGKIVTDCNKL